MARAGQLVPRNVAYALLAFSVIANIYFFSQSRIEINALTNGAQYDQSGVLQNGDIRHAPESPEITVEHSSGDNPSNPTNLDECSEQTLLLNLAETKTTLKDWTFKTAIKCPEFSLDKYPKPRLHASLDCSAKDAKLVYTKTESPQDIYSVDFGDECLAKYIERCCGAEKRVPNVIHYIWYTDDELTFFHFVSFMSVLRFVRPCVILIHGDYIPRGPYWDWFVASSPNVIHVARERPTSIFGHKLAFREHSSDIMRIEALKAYGGIYLDFDEIVLRPLEPLRKYEYTQGHELRQTIGSQLVMSWKNARFLDHWYDSYRTDYRKTWAWNALWIPEKLSRIYPDLIHVEGYNFTRPDWRHAKKQIFAENYDWSTNYGMHLYARFYNGTINTDVIRMMNNTLGSVSRHILFGNKELCEG